MPIMTESALLTGFRFQREAVCYASECFVDVKVSPSAVIVIEKLSLCAFVVSKATVLVRHDCQPLAFAPSSRPNDLVFAVERATNLEYR